MVIYFHLFCVICILVITILGGYFPIRDYDKVKDSGGFPRGEAFSAGVFIALSLTIMLPTGLHLFNLVYPKLNYPLASVIAIISFFLLLSLEHTIFHLQEEKANHCQTNKIRFIIPIVMTAMIAVPSFFLGAAIGISGATTTAIFIFIAVLLHKGSAGFALALKMMKSGMTKKQTLTIYAFFAFATPIGIIVGSDIHHVLACHEVIICKAIIISMAAGVFLYMATLHEFRHSALIQHCCHRRGFLIMLSGFALTALVRYLMGNAHILPHLLSEL